jgi:hypothetical protein
MRNLSRWLLIAGALLGSFGTTGCNLFLGTVISPTGMGALGPPIPVPPWVTERMEDKYCWKNDHRTPIMPPIREGFPPPLCEDPPDEAMILRAMPRVTRGMPYIYEEHRDNIQIVTERIVDKIDPCRFFPLVGPAQLHHCHWKCTVYYTETIESGYPFPFQCRKQRCEVIYIDKDHLHLCAGCDPKKLQTFERELMGN